LRFPDIRLEIVEDLGSSAEGFLRIVRRRLRAHYPDGTSSTQFVYDEVAPCRGEFQDGKAELCPRRPVERHPEGSR
jgi:hypothetical protein